MVKVLWIFFTLFVAPNLVNSYAINKAPDYTLRLVHFNDFHARFEQTSPISTTCVDETQCIGGFPRLYSKIMELLSVSPEAVLLNAGDSFQGTLWYNILKWNVTSYFMNLLPCDAHTLGNHEFDDGVPGVVPYINSLASPMLVANIDDSLEPEIQNTYKPSTIIERNGRRIGIVGVIYSLTNQIANTGKLKFTDEIEAVRKESKKLADQGVDIVIVLSHCGYEIDREIAAKAGENIDIIVGGHSHTLLYNGPAPNGDYVEDVYPVVINSTAGNKVLIVQASAYTKYLGNITVKFNDLGEVTEYSGQPIFLSNSVKQDDRMLKELQPYKEIVDATGKVVVGYSKVDLTKSDCTSGECNLGSFLSDSFVDYFVEEAPEGAWSLAGVAFMPQGGIRTAIPAGSITFNDLVTAQPFQNKVHTLDIKGEHLLQTIEYSASDSFYSLQVSGLMLRINMTKPVGSRIESALIRCNKCDVPTYSPIDPNANYTIATNSFVASGGDGFTALSDNKFNEKVWAVDLDVILEYLKKMSPVYQEKGRRIVLV